jgi:uncharacterized protein
MSDNIFDHVKLMVKAKLEGEGSGHDYYHVLRVFKWALTIAEAESGADCVIVGLGALLHDIGDHKFGYSDEDRQVMIQGILKPLELDEQMIQGVIYIANSISFKGGTGVKVLATLEAKIVQDADRLDALGAIGIARTFAYGGHAGRALYDPTHERGYEDGTDSISHFYQKLLKLKGLMHTETGKALAETRHKRLESFLASFYEEWDVIND